MLSFNLQEYTRLSCHQTMSVIQQAIARPTMHHISCKFDLIYSLPYVTQSVTERWNVVCVCAYLSMQQDFRHAKRDTNELESRIGKWIFINNSRSSYNAWMLVLVQYREITPSIQYDIQAQVLTQVKSKHLSKNAMQNTSHLKIKVIIPKRLPYQVKSNHAR